MLSLSLTHRIDCQKLSMMAPFFYLILSQLNTRKQDKHKWMFLSAFANRINDRTRYLLYKHGAFKISFFIHFFFLFILFCRIKAFFCKGSSCVYASEAVLTRSKQAFHYCMFSQVRFDIVYQLECLLERASPLFCGNHLYSFSFYHNGVKRKTPTLLLEIFFPCCCCPAPSVVFCSH